MNLIPIEYKNQRIITTKIMAEQFGTDETNIATNYNRNKERFQEGKHYFKLEGGELAGFKNILTNSNDVIPERTARLILWTDRGAARHAKILDTDEAWEVYEALEENYFNPKQNKPMCLEDVLITQLQEMKAIKYQLQEVTTTANRVKSEIQGIRDVITLDTTNWRPDSSKIITKIAQKLGGNEHIKDVRREAYELLDKRFGVDVQARLTNKRRRMADEGVCKSKRDKLNQLDVIADDKKLIEGFTAIVKEMAIKYGVEKAG